MLELVARRQHGHGVRAEILRHGSEGAFHVEIIDPQALANEGAHVVRPETTLEAAQRDADSTVAATGHQCDDGCQEWEIG